VHHHEEKGGLGGGGGRTKGSKEKSLTLNSMAKLKKSNSQQELTLCLGLWEMKEEKKGPWISYKKQPTNVLLLHR